MKKTLVLFLLAVWQGESTPSLTHADCSMLEVSPAPVTLAEPKKAVLPPWARKQ